MCALVFRPSSWSAIHKLARFGQTLSKTTPIYACQGYKTCTFDHAKSPPEWRHPLQYIGAAAFSHVAHHEISKTGNFSLSVCENRKTVTLQENSEYTERYHATWLRHHCQCSACKDPDSGQIKLDPADITPDMSIKHVRMNGRSLEVEWNETSHVGEFPVEFLKERLCSVEAYQKQILEKIPSFYKGELPRMTYEDIVSSEEGLWQWIHHLNDGGVCLVQEIPKQIQIDDVVERIAPILPQLYGTIFTVEAADVPINIAYSTDGLVQHMDLSFYEASPGFQFLLCERFDDCIVGGESILTDAWYEAERMRELHPQEFDTLTRVPVTFFRKHFARDNPASYHAKKPHFSMDCGQITGIMWTPHNQTLAGVPEADIEPYYRAMHIFANMIRNAENKVVVGLREGDMISFNNRRFLHGRAGFTRNGGNRVLKGCYVNSDDLKSKAEVLSRKYNGGKPAKRSFNNCVL